MKLIGSDGIQSYSWALTPGKRVVGRSAECEICIPHGTVSRSHAEVTVSDNGAIVTIRDLGSHNGTFLNGQKLTDAEVAHPGDSIVFGRTEFTLLGDDSGGASRSRNRAALAQDNPAHSVFIPINEALRPLPARLTEKPDVFATIFEMARLLVVTEPQETLFSRSLEMIAKIVPSDQLAILSVDENDIYTDASRITNSRLAGRLSLSRSVVREIVNSQSSILITNPKTDPRFAGQQSIIMSEMKSAIAVPLFDDGRVHGVLYADTSNPSLTYTDDHLRILATCGNIIASRISNYNLLREREEKHALEAEMRRASDIQRNLLTTPPKVSGYYIGAYQEQSRMVGGDMYDAAVLPDGQIIFLVADVAGKGLGAALLMSNVLASFRVLYEAQPFILSRLVGRVSRQLYASSADGEFATLFIGILDPATGVIRYVNAGHNPPFVVRTDGRLDTLDATGFMIGAFSFGEWEEAEATLAPGEFVFVYSDGVSEAENSAENQYGEERLAATLLAAHSSSPETIIDKVVSDVQAFVDGAPRSDDITTLLLARR